MSMEWDSANDCLAFSPPGGDGRCVMHRRAFRALLRQEPTPAACLAFAARNQAALGLAARLKMQRAGLGPGARFHITSRDLRGAISGLALTPAEAVEEEARKGAEQRP